MARGGEAGCAAGPRQSPSEHALGRVLAADEEALRAVNGARGAQLGEEKGHLLMRRGRATRRVASARGRRRRQAAPGNQYSHHVLLRALHHGAAVAEVDPRRARRAHAHDLRRLELLALREKKEGKRRRCGHGAGRGSSGATAHTDAGLLLPLLGFGSGPQRTWRSASSGLFCCSSEYTLPSISS